MTAMLFMTRWRLLNTDTRVLYTWRAMLDRTVQVYERKRK